MQDIRANILGALSTALSPTGLGVYSFVPDNTSKPFIYIGEIELTQAPNKSNFYQEGTVMVTLYTGDAGWSGSLSQPLSWLNEIKVRLQYQVAHKLLPQMTYWMLLNDTGLENISDTERQYIANLQYEFHYAQPLTYPDRVVNDGGVVENYVTCVLNKII